MAETLRILMGRYRSWAMPNCPIIHSLRQFDLPDFPMLVKVDTKFKCLF